jgi:hypothetical protein
MKMTSFGMVRRVVSSKVTDVSEVLTASIVWAIAVSLSVYLYD